MYTFYLFLSIILAKRIDFRAKPSIPELPVTCRLLLHSSANLPEHEFFICKTEIKTTIKCDCED